MSHRPPLSGLRAYQRGRIYARDLGESRPPNVSAPGLDAAYGEATPADSAALARAMGRDQDMEIRTLLRRDNRRCFVGWYDERIVTYCWLSLEQEYVGEMERELNLLQGEGYIWNCATLPHYRRQGLYTALLAFMLAQLAEDGYRRIWIGANLENVPSHRAFHSAGFLPAADFTYLRLWRLYTFLTRPLPATPPDLLPHARRLFNLTHLPRLGPLSLGATPQSPISNL